MPANEPSGRALLAPEYQALKPDARVSVIDVNIPFGSMVLFMVKWALAAIPALLILFSLGAIASVIFAALFRR